MATESINNVKIGMRKLFLAELIYVIAGFTNNFLKSYSNNKTDSGFFKITFPVIALCVIALVLMIFALKTAARYSNHFKYAYWVIYGSIISYIINIIFSFFPELYILNIGTIIGNIFDLCRIILVCLGIDQCFKDIQEKDFSDKGLNITLLFIFSYAISAGITIFTSNKGLLVQNIAYVLISFGLALIYLILHFICYIKYLIFLRNAAKFL